MQRKSLALPGAAIGIATLAGLWAVSRTGHRGNRDDAPGRNARRPDFGDYDVVGKTVTIAKPSREELYAFWRDFNNLPSIMENLERVELLDGGRSRWHVLAPGGAVMIETIIAQDRPGELIAWRATEDSEIETEGRVTFSDAPGGRGTRVELIIAYQPPLGTVGRAIATLLQREPAIQARRDLRRFKMLMETGEVATSVSRREEEAA